MRPGSPPFTFSVQAEVWVSQLRLHAQWHVANPYPDLCESGVGFGVCKDWNDQATTLNLFVNRGNQTVYEETYEPKGGHWDGRIYYRLIYPETRGCKPGRYQWTLSAIDPYVRGTEKDLEPHSARLLSHCLPIT
jgi:hypothetical protein